MMPQLPSLSREAIRELDRITIEEIAIPGRVLMECAGRAVADEVLRCLRAEKIGRAVRMGMGLEVDNVDDLPSEPHTVEELDSWKASLHRVETPVGIVCGPGNNGGDGFVVARSLLNQGATVRTCFVGKPDSLSRPGDAAANYQLLGKLDHPVHFIESPEDMESLIERLDSCAVVVDALFGTGLTRSLEGVFREAVEEVNELDKPCVAIDIPSGLDCNRGEILGAAIKADVTVTFAAAKHGMFKGEGPAHCGRVQVVEMGIPRGLIEQALAQATEDSE